MKKHIAMFSFTGWVVLSCVLLSGCVSPGKHTLPRGGTLTMAQIYQEKTGLAISTNAPTRSSMTLTQVRANVQQTVGHPLAQDPSATIRQQFPVLPNPPIMLYVYPHWVNSGGTQVPIPGYITAFFLYRENQFASPAEPIHLTHEDN